jgi:hypothetical protein
LIEVRVSSLVLKKDVRERVVPIADVARAARENTATAVPATGPCVEIITSKGSTATPAVNGTSPKQTASNARNMPNGTVDPSIKAVRIWPLLNPRKWQTTGMRS